MDPNVCLARIRELTSADVLDCDYSVLDFDQLVELARLIESLDGWLSNGGFLPQAWAENCDFDAQMRDQHLRRRQVVRERGESSDETPG
jgi:hypothetical protein